MANHKKILVVQPPDTLGSDRESLLSLLKGTPHALDILDTAEEALQLLGTTTKRYDVIFISGFDTDLMQAMVTMVENNPALRATSILGCHEDVQIWSRIKSLTFSFTKRNTTGWNLDYLLGSFLPSKRLI